MILFSYAILHWNEGDSKDLIKVYRGHIGSHGCREQRKTVDDDDDDDDNNNNIIIIATVVLEVA